MLPANLLATSLILAAAQASTIPDIPLPAERLFSLERYLVKGHALESAPLGRINAVPFEIDHVYVGPAGLKGQKFTAKLVESTFSFNMPKGTGMPVEKGEAAICWIHKGRDGLETLFDTILKNGPAAGKSWLEFPARVGDPARRLTSRNFERGEARYDMAATRADVFEKVYRVSDKERFKVIDGFVRSGDSVKAAAALTLLLSANTRKPAEPPNKYPEIQKNPKIADYVLPLVKVGAAPPRVQRVVAGLLSLNKEGWRESPERWKMYEGWFAGDWKEKKSVQWEVSEERVLVEAMAGARPYPVRRSLQLWLAGLTNPARSDRFKAEFVRQIEGSGRLGDTEEEAIEAFNDLVRTIKTDRTPARRVAGAKLLVAFIPFSAGQRATLEQLSKLKFTGEVRTEIERALAMDKSTPQLEK